MPDEAGGDVLLSVFIVHGVVTPRAVGAAAQRDAADNDDDLWLCADGCTHHSDHLSISLSNFYDSMNSMNITTLIILPSFSIVNLSFSPWLKFENITYFQGSIIDPRSRKERKNETDKLRAQRS